VWLAEGRFDGASAQESPEERFTAQLSVWEQQIREFEHLLEAQGNESENVFHEFLERNTTLLDLYGTVASKPRLHYPNGRSDATGKSYVEPDFIIQRPGRHYSLVELERPSKAIATRQGHPRSEATQPFFQVAEWKDFIRRYPEQLETQFPGIGQNFSCTLIISRDREEAVGAGRNIRSYLGILRQQYGEGVEFLLYDDLLDRAKEAFAKISALNA
jgi:hypothetical protein